MEHVTSTSPAGTWEYHLAHWPENARAALEALADDAGLPREWHATTLVVPGERRHDVDLLLERLQAVPAPAPVLPPAGWYPDPWGLAPWRWWDGAHWTGYVPTPTPEKRPWYPPRASRDAGPRAGWIALLGFVFAEVLSTVFVLVATALGAEVDGLTSLIAGQVGLWAGLLGACIVAARRHADGSLRAYGLDRLTWRDLGRGTLACLVGRFGAGLIAAALLPLLPDEPIRRTTSISGGLDRSPLTVAVVVLIVVVGAPFFEELFFRGLVQGSLGARYSSRFAIWGQALCFAVVHYQFGMGVTQAVLTLVTIFFFGLVLGILRWRYERLAPGMVAHAVFNVIAVIVIYST
jgi:membrane protease YdiL (CAAX protease family)